MSGLLSSERFTLRTNGTLHAILDSLLHYVLWHSGKTQENSTNDGVLSSKEHKSNARER